MVTRGSRQHRSGVAATELGILAPFFLTLLFGLWEVGRLVEIQQIVNNAAREGGRQASTSKYTEAEVAAAVLDYFSNAGLSLTDKLGTANVTVTVTSLDSAGDPTPTVPIKGADQMTRVRVKVVYPYKNIAWLLSSKFVDSSTNLQAEADWFITSDVPLTVPFTIPNQPLT